MDDEGKGSEHVGQPVNNHVLSPPHALKPGDKATVFVAYFPSWTYCKHKKLGRGLAMVYRASFLGFLYVLQVRKGGEPGNRATVYKSAQEQAARVRVCN